MLLTINALISACAAAAVCFGWGGFSGLGWLWMLPLGFAGSFLAIGVAEFLLIWLCCSCVDQNKPQEKDSRFFRFLTRAFCPAIFPLLLTKVETSGLDRLPKDGRFVDQNKPQEKDSRFFRFLTRAFCPAIFPLLLTKVETSGLDRLPKDGRFMLVCNHLDNLDPVLLLAKFPKAQLAFISKRENSTMFIVGNLMHKLQCQLLNRENDREALKTILKCISILKEDKASIAVFPEGYTSTDGLLHHFRNGVFKENDREALKTILKCISILKEDKASIAVFPEGYTSTDGLLHHFRNGVFKIAQKAQVPIVVCTVQGTNSVFHNAARLKRSVVKLHLLDVIPAADLAGIHTNQIGDRVYDLMAGTNSVFHNAARLKRSVVKLHLLDVIPAADLAGIHTNQIGDRVYDLMAKDLGPGLVAEE